MIDKAELRRLAEAASSRPWQHHGDEKNPNRIIGRERGGWIARLFYKHSTITGMTSLGPETFEEAYANAAYIVAACNAVPALLDELEAAEAAVIGTADAIAPTLYELGQKLERAERRVERLREFAQWCILADVTVFRNEAERVLAADDQAADELRRRT